MVTFLSAGYIAHNLPDILIKMRAGQICIIAVVVCNILRVNGN